MAVKDNLKRIMELRGKDVAEICEATGIPKQSLYKWLSGEYKPNQDNLEKLGKYLNVEVKDFYDENLTSVVKSDEQLENKIARETFYRDLIEGNDEYSILPKALLKDYKMIPEKIMDQITKTNDELKDALVTKYEIMIQKLEKDNADLRSRLGLP